MDTEIAGHKFIGQGYGVVPVGRHEGIALNVANPQQMIKLMKDPEKIKKTIVVTPGGTTTFVAPLLYTAGGNGIPRRGQDHDCRPGSQVSLRGCQIPGPGPVHLVKAESFCRVPGTFNHRGKLLCLERQYPLVYL